MTRKQALRQAKANLKRRADKRLALMPLVPGTITYRRKQVGTGFIYESLDDHRNLGVH